MRVWHTLFVRRRLPIHLLLGAIASAMVVGCVLLVNDDASRLTTTCNFTGNPSACDLCVASACEKPLDDCCGDSTCSQVTLPLLAACIEANPNECSALAVGAPDLTSCVTSSCPACTGTGKGADGGIASTDAGTTNCTQEGDSCFCLVGELPPNGASCNTAGIKGGGLCCASYGWPQATEGTCSCEPFSCTPTSTGASCSLSSNSTGTTTWSEGTCCSEGTFCDCDFDESCPETPVAECSVAAIGCGASQVQVESCSF